MKPVGEIIRERNIRLNTIDPVVREGFTQIPNFILRNPQMSMGARVVYAMFLSYAWHNDSCFPGQDRLAAELGMSRSSVTAFIGELEDYGLIEIKRRGLGKTNIYTINFRVSDSRLASRSQPADLRKSARSSPMVSRLATGGQPADLLP